MPLKPGTWSVDRASIDPTYDQLWSGLDYLLPFFEQTGNRTHVYGKLAARFNRQQGDIPTSMSRGGTDMGLALDHENLRFQLDTAYVPPNQGTWLFCASFIGTGETASRAYGSHDAFEVRLGFSGGLFRVENHLFAASTENLKGPFLLLPDKTHVIALTWDLASTQQKIYYNGVLVASANFADDTPTAATLWSGGRSTPFFHGEMLLMAQWDRVLGPGDVQLLQTDPFGMIREAQWPTWPALPAAAPDERLPLRIRRPVYYPRRKREQVFT